MTEVAVSARLLERFLPIVGGESVGSLAALAAAIRERFAGRIVWNINSTAAGGGVAEMLQALLPYVRGAGIDTRWAVLRGNPDFFRLTKRLHHALHGCTGDGSGLGAAEHEIYRATMGENAAELGGAIRAHDIVILHDPQTAGLASYLIDIGALVVWRCHIGHDSTNDEVENGWHFLQPYLRDVPAFVFSRDAYVPSYCDHGKSTIITPSIDAFSPKNQEMEEATVRSIMVHVGLVEGPNGAAPVFIREDGSPGRVDRQADVIRHGRAPSWDVPLIVQVSRWDPLKDPVGVIEGFAHLLQGGLHAKAELVLAGPNVTAVTDDPEGAQTFNETIEAWRQLPPAIRSRVHLVSLPMADIQENAAIVNALQRHAALVVQKSLHEGFGLTVTEAMWKAKPVVASAVGGIQDQIVDGEHGLLLSDPRDRDAFASSLRRLLEDPDYGRKLGENARRRVADEFLGLHSLAKYAALLDRLDRAHEAAGRPGRFAAKA